MKAFLHLITLLVLSSCLSNKEFVYYQIIAETENIKSKAILAKTMYQKVDNQCGALFLEGTNLTVINNHDTSQVFINLKFHFENNKDGLYKAYAFEDVFLKNNEKYQLVSKLRADKLIFKTRFNKLILVDKSFEKKENDDGSITYFKTYFNSEGKELKEVYTVHKTILTKVLYEEYEFPCE